MFNEKVISKDMENKFSKGLKEHQLALTADGENNVLQKTVLEHNIQVVSHIYKNISFKGLGRFLNISPKMAELLISTMVTEGRIEAVLD